MGLKVLEKVMDEGLRKIVTIGDAQFGFQPEKGAMGCNVYFEASARHPMHEIKCSFSYRKSTLVSNSHLAEIKDKDI